MFTDPFPITIDSVQMDLSKVNQDANGSDWYLDYSATTKFAMSIRHTIPARGGAGESHMIRLDTHRYADDVYTQMGSVWLVAKTFDGVQATTSLTNEALGFVGSLTSGTLDKLLGRQV